MTIRYAPDAKDCAALHLAEVLGEVAEALDAARDLPAFRAAIDAHCRVWREIGRLRRLFGWPIPMSFETFALSVSPWMGRRLSDHDVEVLIDRDREVAALLNGGAGMSCATLPGALLPEALPELWRDWMRLWIGDVGERNPGDESETARRAAS